MILATLQEKGISQYLIAVIRSYFHGRTINSEGTVYTQTAGITHGSVIGPLLWNILYDPILKLDYPSRVKAIEFADDLTLIIQPDYRLELDKKISGTLAMINNWIDTNGLKVVPEKTSLIILNGRRANRDLEVKFGGSTIAPTNHLKYLHKE